MSASSRPAGFCGAEQYVLLRGVGQAFMVPGPHKVYIKCPHKVLSASKKLTLCSKRVAGLHKVRTIAKNVPKSAHSSHKVCLVPNKCAWCSQSHVVLRAHKAKSLLSGLTGHAYALLTMH